MYFYINYKKESWIIPLDNINKREEGGSFLEYVLIKKYLTLDKGTTINWIVEAIDEDFARLSNVVALSSSVKYSDSLFVNGPGRGWWTEGWWLE